jgi:hypothetical protein
MNSPTAPPTIEPVSVVLDVGADGAGIEVCAAIAGRTEFGIVTEVVFMTVWTSVVKLGTNTVDDGRLQAEPEGQHEVTLLKHLVSV